MAATKFKVTIGEDTVEYTVKPGHILRSEREDGDLPAVESMYRMAWYASGAGGEFEDWINSVDDLEAVLPEGQGGDGSEDDEESVPPTTAGSRRSRSKQG